MIRKAWDNNFIRDTLASSDAVHEAMQRSWANLVQRSVREGRQLAVWRDGRVQLVDASELVPNANDNGSK